mmetsp:Transcript_3591/g.14545  ORF Transcript_3591/g.14545 Transcript_3591/m.14545 type:complete len:247 (-) Transcript_3591:256-996(-)|eukprot:PRCOL_00005781-RA
MRRVTEQPLVDGMPLRFSLLRVPFFLEPDYPRSEEFEETNLERLRRKWGGVQQFEEQKKRHGLKERGREVGIENFVARRIASNTWASHRMVQWVTRTLGVSAAERLYAALNFTHFEQGAKLNDREMLVTAAVEHAGADEAAAREFLQSDEGSDEIAAALAMLREMGINSIPTFLIDGKYMLSGAAHADEFVRLFRDMEKEEAKRLVAAGENAHADDEFAEGAFLFSDALRIPREMLLEELDLAQHA